MDVKGKNFKTKIATNKNVFVVSPQTYKTVKNAKQNVTCCKFGRNTFKICDTERVDGNQPLKFNKYHEFRIFSLNIKFDQIQKQRVEHVPGSELDSKTSTMQSDSKSLKSVHEENFCCLENIHKQKNKDKPIKINDEGKSLEKNKTRVEHEPGSELDSKTTTKQSDTESVKPDHEDNFSSLEVIHKQKSKGKGKDCDVQDNIIPNPSTLCQNVIDIASKSDNKTSPSLSDSKSDTSDHEESFSSLEIIHKQKNKGILNENSDEEKFSHKTKTSVEHERDNELNSGITTQSDSKSIRYDHEENFSSLEIIHKQKNKEKPNKINDKAKSFQKSKTRVEHVSSCELVSKTATMQPDSKSVKPDHEYNFSSLEVIHKQKSKGKNIKYITSESDSKTSTSLSDSESDESDHEDNFSSLKIIQEQTNRGTPNEINDEANFSQKTKTIVEHEPGNELYSRTSTMQSDSKSIKPDEECNFSSLEIIHKHKSKRKEKDCDVQDKIILNPNVEDIAPDSDSKTSTSLSDSKSDKSDHEENFSSLEIIHKKKSKGKQNGNSDEAKSLQKTKTTVEHEHHRECDSSTSKSQSISKSTKKFSSLEVNKQKCNAKPYENDTKSKSINREQIQKCFPQGKSTVVGVPKPVSVQNTAHKYRKKISTTVTEVITDGDTVKSRGEPDDEFNGRILSWPDSQSDKSEHETWSSKLTEENRISQAVICSPKQSDEIPIAMANEVLQSQDIINDETEVFGLNNVKPSPINLKKKKKLTNIEKDISERHNTNKVLTQTNLRDYLKKDTSLSQKISDDGSKVVNTVVKEINARNESNKSMDEENEENDDCQNLSQSKIQTTPTKHKTKHLKDNLLKSQNCSMDPIEQNEQSENLFVSTQDISRENYSTIDLEDSDCSVDSEIQPRKRSQKRLLNSTENISSPKKLKTKHISCTPPKIKKQSLSNCETDSCSGSLSINKDNSQYKNITSVTDNTTSSRKRKQIQHLTCEPDFEKLTPESKSSVNSRLTSSMSSFNSEENIASGIDSDETIMSQSRSGTSKSKTKPKRKICTSTPHSGFEHLPSLRAFKSRLEQRTHSFKTDLSIVDELESQSDITSKELLKELMEEVQTSNIASEEDLERLTSLNIQITWKLSELHRVDSGSQHLTVNQILAKHPNLEIDSSTFSKDEEDRIKKNWNKFSRKYEFDNPTIFMSSHQLHSYFRIGERLKFKQFIARKLPNRRLASVYRKFTEVFAVLSKGRWSKKEDQLLLTLYKAYDTLDESSCAVPRKTMLSKALGRTWMSIHRRLAILFRDDYSKQLMEMDIDWTAELEGRVIHYLLRSTRSNSTEDLRHAKIPVRVWCKVAAKLELPMSRIVTRWNNHLYPQLYARQSVLRRDLYIQLIKWLHDHEIRRWKDIDWTNLSVRCGDLGSDFLYHCLISLVNNFVPKKVAKDCRASIDYLNTEYVPKLMKKKTSMLLKRITYNPEERIVVELEEDEAEFASFRIQ